jgi:hypothetical protein
MAALRLVVDRQQPCMVLTTPMQGLDPSPWRHQTMPTNLTPNVAALPLYQLGLHNGQDVGLRLALDALTAEPGRQEQLLAAEPDSGSPATACLVYAARCLLDVSKTLAAQFRRGAR